MPSGSRIVLRTAAEADIPTPDTDQTVLFMDADDSGAPAYKDDGGTVHSMVGTAGADGVLSYLDHGNTGSTETVDASAGDIQRLVANAATVTLTLTGWPSAGTPGIVRLWLEQDASAPRSWVFPGSVDWGEPGEPDWSTRGAGDVDLVDLMSVDGGTTVIAVLGGREGPARWQRARTARTASTARSAARSRSTTRSARRRPTAIRAPATSGCRTPRRRPP
jgi:hypothetical protein